MLSNYISLYVFLVSFSIGLFFIYILGPEIKTIYIYPSTYNYDNVLYKDSADNCYKFKPIETKCPLNPFEIKTIPIQDATTHN
jgi:hypothetical protein